MSTINDDLRWAEDQGIIATNGHLKEMLPDEWSELLELPPVLPPVPSLPEEMVPEALLSHLADAAGRACIPLEMVTIPALVSLSSVIGRKVGIHPNRYDSFTVVLNLWGYICARPGSLKTHAIEVGTAPVKRLAAKATDRYQVEVDLAEVQKAAIESEIAAVKASMKKEMSKKSGNIEDFKHHLADLIRELREIEPIERRYLTQDATVAKLGEILKQNPVGLMVLRDEVAGLIAGMERSGSEGDREFYLESWNGSGSYTFDRIGRGTVHIAAVTLSLLGGIQPGKLIRLVEDAKEGVQADGLLQRFQLAVWPDSLGEWDAPTTWENRRAKDDFFAIYEALDGLDAEILEQSFEVSKDDENRGIPAIRFSPEAQKLFDNWRSELETRLRSQELLNTPAFESHIAKYRSLMPSLALLFHLVGWAALQPRGSSEEIKGFDGLVSSPSPCSGEFSQGVCLKEAKMAAAWCDYLERHACKIYANELNPVASAHSLADRIKEGAVEDGKSIRDITRHDWAGLANGEAVEEAISTLAGCHWVKVESISPGSSGGRPSRVLRLNPCLMKELDG